MTGYFRGLITAALFCSAAMAQFTEFAPPPVPAAIQVPAGNVAYLKASAVGTQNYICMSTSAGFAWTFTGPQATLFVTFNWMNTTVRQQVTTHYLSPNPMEAGTARATWQSSFDTSAVWGRAIANSSDPAFVGAGAIPWLLLEAVGRRPGPEGGSLLNPTTYLQRVNTTGGVAPATGCSDGSNVGRTAFVPYTADYIFFKSSARR